jgi:hypothetical protein
MADTYTVNTGLTYPTATEPAKSVEPGEQVSDIPASSIPWLLADGLITPVGAPAPQVPSPGPVAPPAAVVPQPEVVTPPAPVEPVQAVSPTPEPAPAAPASPADLSAEPVSPEVTP